jgi:hypothetical protein
MSLQIFAGSAGSTFLMEAKAVKYAADNGAVILQCSWGYNSGLANMNNYVPGFTSDDQWAESCVLEKDVIESIKETTGFDITDVMKANTIQAKTDRNISVDGVDGVSNITINNDKSELSN